MIDLEWVKDYIDIADEDLNELAVKITKAKLDEKGNVVVESLYSWDELKIAQERFGSQVITVSVVADKELRYDRLAKRDVRPFSREEAIKRDITEIENIAKAGPIAYADYFIDNNGTISEFHESLQKFLEKIK